MGAKLDKGILYFEIACQNYTFTPLSTQWPPCLCLWVRQFAPTPHPPRHLSKRQKQARNVTLRPALWPALLPKPFIPEHSIVM